MSIETKTVSFTADQWVLVARGAEPVTIWFREGAQAKMFIGLALPVIDTTDYSIIDLSEAPISIDPLGDASAWLQAASERPAKVSVIRGVLTAVAAPALVATPKISGVRNIGQALTVSTGSWLNSPTTYLYQWMRDGVKIQGATLSSYTIAAADAGKSVVARVTAINEGGASAVLATA